MQDISEWAGEFGAKTKPWLLLGKGPTFQQVHDLDLTGYYVCSLNHVVRELPVTLAHIIDIDVVVDCADEIDRNARFLAMPHRPHAKNFPSEKTLPGYVSEIPVLAKLEKEGRLLWYNLSSSAPHGKSPVIKAKFFSAEAALNLLVTCGAKVVRSLGVDGGQTYSGRFDDLKQKTLLANGHQDFDKQFKGICETIRKSNVLYAPLYVAAPIRVFVGADETQMLGARMLEYSIKKHTPLSVEVVPLVGKTAQMSGVERSELRRFLIPELCGYQGRAIYMDPAMLVFTDLAKLWTWRMAGTDIVYSQQPAHRPMHSVMLMNCSRLRWDPREIAQDLDQQRYSHEALLMRTFRLQLEDRKRAVLPFEWNSLEHYEEGTTSAMNYPDTRTHPWISNKNPYAHLWYALLRDAIREGFVTKEELASEIQSGYVSPELPRWAGLPGNKSMTAAVS